MAPKPPPAEWESLTHAAARIGYSVDTLRTLISRGELKAYRLNTAPRSALRVRIVDVDSLLKPTIPAEIYGD